MQTGLRLIAPRPNTLTDAIPDYRTPEQLDRKAVMMSLRDFNLTGGWKQTAIKANRRYLQAENDLVLLKETLKQQAAALEAKDELIKYLADDLQQIKNPPIYLERLRPGDPRASQCFHTISYLNGAARECGFCHQINRLFPGTPLGKPRPEPAPSSLPRTATGYSPARPPQEQCPLEFLQSDLGALDKLIAELHPDDTLGLLSLSARRKEVAQKIAIATDRPIAVVTGKDGLWTNPAARAAADQSARRVAEEPNPRQDRRLTIHRYTPTV
jgi:hypothetical protein